MRDRSNRGWRPWLAASLMLVALDASAALLPFENVRSFYQTMESGGDTRTALYLTPNVRPPAGTRVPLLIVLHYLDGEPEPMANFTVPGFLVRDYGIYVILPQGIGGDWTHNPDDKTGPDDVGYISALIDDALAQYPIDARRVYIAGYSAGGNMVNRYVCEHPERIAGAAVVAATMRTALRDVCTETTPVPMILFNGTEDGRARYDGSNTPLYNPYLGTDTISARENAERWATINGCLLNPAHQDLPDLIADHTTISVDHYANCSSGLPVDFYTVNGGGHTWPGAIDAMPRLGLTNQDLNATATMWAFFSQFAKP